MVPLNEEPQLLFAQGTVGLEIFNLSIFLFSIQRHRWYIVRKFWSDTCAFYFWCIDGKPTSHATTSLIHLTIIPYEAWKFPEKSSSLTGSSPKFRNRIIDLNLSLVITDLKSSFLYNQSWDQQNLYVGMATSLICKTNSRNEKFIFIQSILRPIRLVCSPGNRPIFKTNPRSASLLWHLSKCLKYFFFSKVEKSLQLFEHMHLTLLQARSNT